MAPTPPDATSVAGLLTGVTVLDLSSVGPATRAARWLADYGAAVIKVGPVPRDGTVQITPPAFAYAGRRGWRRALLDLKDPGGREAFLALARDADVLLESFRPGVMDRLGLGYEDVRAANPAIVYCSTTGYGQDGPHAGWAGHDLDYLAVGGYLSCSTPRADGGPPLPGATIADAAAGGMHAVMSILAALVHRSRTGEGRYLDVAVADGVLSLMSLAIDEHLATGAEPAPRHDLLTGRYACYDLYRARDGGWLAVAAIEPVFWANLCRALGLDRWIQHQHDDAVQAEVRRDLAEALGRRDRDDWVTELAPANTCVAPVHSVAEVVSDPQFGARAAFVNAEHPQAGGFRQLAPVLAGQVRPHGPVALPDPDETHTLELLAAAGVDDRRLEELQARGAVA